MRLPTPPGPTGPRLRAPRLLTPHFRPSAPPIAAAPLPAADTVERIMRPADFARLRKASSMPLFCIESLMRMVQRYATDAVPADAKRMMNLSIHNLMAPFADADRIKNNPVAFAYITHLRLLLVIYLTALPLALVESLGWSTIPVFFAISYSLMSLEMIGACLPIHSALIARGPRPARPSPPSR